MSSAGLQDLNVWVKAKAFAVFVYKEILPILPEEEKYGLNQQIRRAAVSISSNIAEGYGRFNFQDNIRFCYIARGSLNETISMIALSEELGFMPRKILEESLKLSEDLAKMLHGYISFLKKTKTESQPKIIRDMNEKYRSKIDIDNENDLDQSDFALEN
ncbi:MAG: hypothetical protein BGO78_09520 [Chloroflexi bacterium 44-23]|nr:MAG: hypothetical protein BGO78_09520 [Chloroflexi bacterium 44-23]